MIIDQNIPRKEKITRDRLQFVPGTKIPLMSVVEISNSGMCNRKCSFCPRSDPNYPDINEFISNKLHKKIFSELSELKFNGMVIYSGYVEPLLHKKIYENIAEARHYLPEAQIEIISNGDVLNKKRLTNLFLSGLDRLFISVYDTVDDVKRFENLAKECDLSEKVIVRDRTLPPEEDFGITMSNRAGMLKNAEHKVLPLNKKLDKACYYPAYTFFMDYNGDVLMCAHDWGKKRILGNLNNDTFLNLWTSKFTNVSRKMLINGNRSVSPCNVCDVKGTLIGKKHVQAWNNKYEKEKKI